MEQWWSLANEALQKEQFNSDTYAEILKVANSHVILREGCVNMVKMCDNANIPFIIFSAGIADIIDVSATPTISSQPSHTLNTQSRYIILRHDLITFPSVFPLSIVRGTRTHPSIQVPAHRGQPLVILAGRQCVGLRARPCAHLQQERRHVAR